jgi:hypothetical protein
VGFETNSEFLQGGARRAGHCEFHRGVPAMVPESIVKPEAAPLEELLSFSTALADGILDTLNQGFRIEWLM